MNVKILVEFDVTGTEDLWVAKEAARIAAEKFLCFALNFGLDEVTVHVDGYGVCEVKLGDDHE